MGISSRLTTTAAHTRISRVANGRGGQTQSWASQGNVLCRISMKSSSERIIANREEGIGNYKIFIDDTEDVQMHDRLTVSGLVYEVVGIIRPSRGLHIELEALLIEPGA